MGTQKAGADVLPLYRMTLYTANEQSEPAIALRPDNGVISTVYTVDYNIQTGDPGELRMRRGFHNVNPPVIHDTVDGAGPRRIADGLTIRSDMADSGQRPSARCWSSASSSGTPHAAPGP